MSVLENLSPKTVFKYFEEISAIPRGSGNMKAIADYCVSFANENSLKFIRDDANNVIIYKNASKGYENSEPIMLQGHLDIVCQKTADSDFDFLNDGLKLYIDGDFIKAKNTTLGADNGIAAAIMMSILADDGLSHPPIEAVFTTDEEIGMVGALQLDTSALSGKKMINLDAEELGTVTVSCAGGSDFKAVMPYEKTKTTATALKITLNGLKGGHSGICIGLGRANSNVLAGRLLNYLNKNTDFDLISVNGGDKGNAIPLCSVIELCSENAKELKEKADEYLKVIKEEIATREPDFSYQIEILGEGEQICIENNVKKDLIYSLTLAPGGVVEMSAEIEGLVETSLNLGVLETRENEIYLHFALRSNKKSALKYLEERLFVFFSKMNAKIETGGHYPPWEFNSNSTLQTVYKEVYSSRFNKEPKVEAIHAGLECGVFADKIEGFDCIAIGAEMYDIHTVNERVSISSTEQLYNMVIEILKKCK